MIKISFQENVFKSSVSGHFIRVCVCAMFGISHLFLLLRINPFILDSWSKVPQKMVRESKKDGHKILKLATMLDEIIVHEIGARKLK